MPYVIVQVLLIALVLFGPRATFTDSILVTYAGAFLILVGGVFLLSSMLRLGDSLTPLPKPKENAKLVREGPYRFVRHPIYAGAILLCYGFALVKHSWPTIIYAIVMHLFLWWKAIYEEKWLAQRYPEYAEYQKTTPRLIPFV